MCNPDTLINTRFLERLLIPLPKASTMKTVIYTVALSIFFFSGEMLAQNADHSNLSKGTFQSYTTKDGNTYRIGQQVEIGLPSSDNGFNWISQNGQKAANFLAGKTITISKLKTYGNKKQGFKMYAHFKGYGLPVLIDLEVAERTGEIIVAPSD